MFTIHGKPSLSRRSVLRALTAGSALALNAQPHDRVTVVLVWVPALWCKSPKFNALTDIGIALPAGIRPTNPTLEMLDNNSKGWQPKVPNLTSSWITYPENQGRTFHGWRVENGDENNERYLKGTFHWSGDGPDIVQSLVGSIHACGAWPPKRGSGSGARSEIGCKLGIALPANARPPREARFRVRAAEAGANWTEALGNFIGGWQDAQTPPAAKPEDFLPNQKVLWATVTNKDLTQARAIRLIVTQDL